MFKIRKGLTECGKNNAGKSSMLRPPLAQSALELKPSESDQKPQGAAQFWAMQSARPLLVASVAAKASRHGLALVAVI